MKIYGQDAEAFLLGSCLSAIAMHGTCEGMSRQPSVQILNLAGGICVSGEESLQALLEAVEYALYGPKEKGPPTPILR